MVATVTPDRHHIQIVNENYEEIDFDTQYDVVGISVLTINAKRAYDLADFFRKKRATVVLGGYHVSALPKEGLEHADAVVVGEAENLWPQVINDIEQDSLQSIYASSGKPDVSMFPTARRDLYVNMLSGAVQATRGCPVGCEFCPTTRLLGKKVRKRPVDAVVEEMKCIPNKVIIFRDASLTLDPRYSKALFKRMKKLDKKWIANGNLNVLGRDTEFLELAREAGCLQWFVGFESISKETLKQIHKTTNVNIVDRYGEYVHKIQRHGMGVSGGIIFGFDNDTPEVFEETYEAIEEWQPDAIEFNILTPYPGTAIYERFERENRILTRDWSKYSQAHVVYQPKNMTVDELREGYRWITKKYYSWPEMLKRILRYWGYAASREKSPSLLSIPTINLALRSYYQREIKRIEQTQR
ncbi:MAG: B12-binding domain-containing radical SAM protein [Thermoplasmatota archaeon]